MLWDTLLCDALLWDNVLFDNVTQRVGLLENER